MSQVSRVVIWKDAAIRSSLLRRRTMITKSSAKRIDNSLSSTTSMNLQYLSSSSLSSSSNHENLDKVSAAIGDGLNEKGDSPTSSAHRRARELANLAARQRNKEARQRRHLAKMAADKEAKLRRQQQKDQPSMQRWNVLPAGETSLNAFQKQQQQEFDNMERQKALQDAVFRQQKLARHLKPNGSKNTTTATTITNDPKLRAYNNAAMAIPAWLSRSPECLQMTMKELQSLSDNATTTTNNNNYNKNNSNSFDLLMENFRRLYYQSLASYKSYLTDPNTTTTTTATTTTATALPPYLIQALDQLVQVGFGELTFVKAYQSTVVAQPRIQQLNDLIKRTQQAQKEDVKYLTHLEAKLKALKEKKQQQEQEQQLVEHQTAKEVEEKKSKSLISWSQDIINFVLGSTRQQETTGAEPTHTITTTTTSLLADTGTNLNPSTTTLSSQQLQADDNNNNNNIDKDLAGLERFVEQKKRKMQDRILEVQRLKDDLQSLIASLLPLAQFDATQAVVNDVLPLLCRGLATHIRERFGTVIQAYQLLSSQTDLTRPHDWYLYARMNRRKIIFHGGPTNSGKTYAALQRLKTAQRGLYLGPLRLLAAEIYDTLTMQGIYCNLLTGQEKREVPFATHSAATVEMASPDTEYDVVVIDEIQMIADESRGHAWTKALLSLRCKEIHVCGGLEAKNIIQKIAETCGDEFELCTYKRFSDLRIASQSIAQYHHVLGSYKAVQPGDCVVAFSRNDIFAIKKEIEKNTKHKCCVIYGSLPPQTRAEQAHRFNDPDSGYDVLVASDAIGMGLNLNIRRIVFHTIFKSDGQRIIRLDHSSVKQIAGRAGRRNSPFPDGEVTCRDPRDMDYLRQCMTTEILPIQQAGLMPTPAHIELFHTALNAGLGEDQIPISLHQLLPMFNEFAVVQGNYFLCRQSEMQVIAKVLADYDLPLSEKYIFCTAPINTNSVIPMTTLRKFVKKHTEGAAPGLPWRDVPRPAKSFDDLTFLCNIYAQLDLFQWLQQKFSKNVLEIKTALARKEETTAHINAALKDAEKLKLNHCYLKRDRATRQQWQLLNSHSRGKRPPPGGVGSVASSNSSNTSGFNFGELDNLLIPADESATTPLLNNDLEHVGYLFTNSDEINKAQPAVVKSNRLSSSPSSLHQPQTKQLSSRQSLSMLQQSQPQEQQP